MLLPDPSDGPPAPRAASRPIVVHKYGGSSVADTDKLGRVADRVVAARREGFDVVVVVSAMGKTTDELMSLASDVTGSGEAPRREIDMLVSTGERVSMALLSIAIQARGCDAISFTGSQSGIITNDRHCDARIIEVRPHRIEDELARGRVVIVAGYQGMSYKREITTLGRGGSDTTAVALAAALEAERCEIHSDVDGVYSADPRAVDGARHLPELDYETLQEMAESGAKVVCAQAVEWARRAGVVLYARSTFEDSQRATVVRKFAPSDRPTARAVTVDEKVALIGLDDDLHLPAVLGAMEQAGVLLRELQCGGGPVRVLGSLRNAPDPSALLEAVEGLGSGATLRRTVAQISVVGAGLGEHPASLAGFRAALHDAGAAAHLLSASPLRLSAAVDAAAATRCARALHARFVER